MLEFFLTILLADLGAGCDDMSRTYSQTPVTLLITLVTDDTLPSHHIIMTQQTHSHSQSAELKLGDTTETKEIVDV